MKKIFYTSSVLAALSLTLLSGCKKDTVAFPDKVQNNGTYADLAYITPNFPVIADADGILISAQVTNQKTIIISPFANEYEYGMAKFTNTTGNFSNLADAGTITLNDSTLAKSSTFSYLSTANAYTLNLSNTAKWNVGGNGAFGGIAYTGNSNNPNYSNSITNWDSKWVPTYPRNLTLGSSTYHLDSLYNVSPAYSIPIKNYTDSLKTDSVNIVMVDNTGFYYSKTVSSKAITADFAPNDFASKPSFDISSFKLQINAINYDTAITVNSKKYYFLKMQSNIKYYGATK